MREMDVRVWLFSHGFEDRYGTLRCNYSPYRVCVRIEEGVGQLWLASRRFIMPVREFLVSDLRVDGHGMLRGAGLEDLFIEQVRLGEPIPYWYPKDYPVPGKPVGPDPRGSRKVLVAKWLYKHGFERMPSGHFEVRDDNVRICVELGNKKVVTTILPRNEQEVSQVVDLEDVIVDRHGVLRGTGLGSYFLDRIEQGGDVPSWLPTKFTNAHVEGSSVAMR